MVVGEPTILGNPHLLLESSGKNDNPRTPQNHRPPQDRRDPAPFFVFSNGRELGIFPRFN